MVVAVAWVFILSPRSSGASLRLSMALRLSLGVAATALTAVSEAGERGTELSSMGRGR